MKNREAPTGRTQGELPDRFANRPAGSLRAEWSRGMRWRPRSAFHTIPRTGSPGESTHSSDVLSGTAAWQPFLLATLSPGNIPHLTGNIAPNRWIRANAPKLLWRIFAAALMGARRSVYSYILLYLSRSPISIEFCEEVVKDLWRNRAHSIRRHRLMRIQCATNVIRSGLWATGSLSNWGHPARDG